METIQRAQSSPESRFTHVRLFQSTEWSYSPVAVDSCNTDGLISYANVQVASCSRITICWGTICSDSHQIVVLPQVSTSV